MAQEKKSLGNLVAFHTQHKLLLLSHSEKHYRAMGKLVAEGRKLPLSEVFASYETLLMEALKLKTTVKRNTNVLQHMMGYFSDELDPASRAELAQTITDYRLGQIPLVVPVTLIRHFVRLYDVQYLAGQVYLEPHPRELMLRNHV